MIYSLDSFVNIKESQELTGCGIIIVAKEYLEKKKNYNNDGDTFIT